IAGAGLDVFAKEPCPADNPLLQMNNVIVAPHSLGWTDYFALTTAKSVADGILATYNGEMPVNTVNRRQIEATGVLPRLRHRKG
ncbi:MAG TPA: NAD(P)-dependent oxidoreductase, partial [Thermomicrobiales bacterium]|nr:NAD(P)-dependent oxidoreductase [Thermomicrobiales bacterium]